LVIQGKDGEIAIGNKTIRELEAEIQRLLNNNAAGDQASQDLLRQLAEKQK